MPDSNPPRTSRHKPRGTDSLLARAGIQAGDKDIGAGSLKAGGDLIVALDGREVRTFDELLSYLITHKSPGDTVVLTVLRGDERKDISVTLGKRP